MKTALIALTRNASALACRLAPVLDADLYLKPGFASELLPEERERVGEIPGEFAELVHLLFRQYQALVFIMATGIVVRSIASCLKGKRRDPAVVVIDEAGRFAISLLSGHWGGANELAQRVAGLCGGQAVITTATDVNGMVAFDEFARRNGCEIENPEMVKTVSSCLVNGGSVLLLTETPPIGPVPAGVRVMKGCSAENDLVRGNRPLSPDTSCQGLVYFGNRYPGELPGPVLVIRPRNLVLGLGCRKGTSAAAITNAVHRLLEHHGFSALSLRCVATIPLKEHEPGLRTFCGDNQLPLQIVAMEQIIAVQEAYAASDFVRGVTGVGAVAEPAAVLAGRQARLVVGKTAGAGISLALAEETQEYLW